MAIFNKDTKTMSKAEVMNFFNSNFGEYDEWIYKVVPCYEEMQKQITKVISCFFSSFFEMKVLELGFGTGRTAKEVLESFSNSHVDGIEFSEKMTELAKKKLKRFEGKYKIQLGDFTKTELPPEKYDVIISSLSMHHYELNEIEKIMLKIYSALKKGGIFVNADIVKFKSEEYSKKAQEFYLDYIKTELKNEMAVKVWKRHIELQDKPSSLNELLDMLSKSGFKDVSSPWRQWNFAVYSGRK